MVQQLIIYALFIQGFLVSTTTVYCNCVKLPKMTFFNHPPDMFLRHYRHRNPLV